MRKDPGTIGIAAAVVAFALGLFHLYTGAFGVSSAMLQRGLHWTVLSVLVFLLYPAGKKSGKKPGVIDYLFAAAATVTGVYGLLSWERVAVEAGVTNTTDMVMGVIALIVVLEATRRVVGLALTITGGLFLLYAYFGAWIPGFMGHRFYTVQRIIAFLYSSTEGIYGIAMSVSATYVALFVIFGAVLEKFGGGQFFVDLALMATGRLKGGPAKAAVISSAMMGTISGSAVANVVTTGTFTIPLMKRIGYKPHVAGAVEAVASTGGQIMPPVMGAAAFLMAEMINVPYIEVMKAAAIPALLYFLSIYLIVHLEAVKENIPVLSDEERPKIDRAFARKLYLLIPVFVLIALILKGMTPMKAVVWAVAFILGLDLVLGGAQAQFPARFYAAISDGMKSTISVAAACACSGIIVGVTSMTGLGLKISQIMLALAGSNILLALLLTMVASLILGCGLPTTAAYVVLATMAVPALVKLGVPVLAAHLFVFYFGCISTITPPVALSAYAGGAIAGADPNVVGWTAFRFGLISFIVPYMLVYGPGLMMSGPLLEIIRVTTGATVGVFGFGVAIQGYGLTECTPLERVLAFLGGVLLIDTRLITDLAGLGMLVLFVVIHMGRARKARGIAGRGISGGA
ncbi:MAG: TRAP transporter permease [Firmicutes bacterium]|nr:TRAP transporter permease [Bacillota bacterium]